MSTLDIPDEYVDGTNLLLQMNDEIGKKFIEALSESQPTLYIENLVESVSQQLKDALTSSDVEDMMDALLALYGVRDSLGIETSEFIKNLEEAVLESESFPDISKNNLQISKPLIMELLDLDEPLSIASKAFNVLLDHERIFLGSKILTDIRPIFSNRKVESPVSAVIVHMLKVDYREGSERKEFFVALDTSDINKLENVLRRAKLKEKAIQPLLKRADVAYLDIEEN
jgi:hypothetical protein